jgi:hypothetical protein
VGLRAGDSAGQLRCDSAQMQARSLGHRACLRAKLAKEDSMAESHLARLLIGSSSRDEVEYKLFKVTCILMRPRRTDSRTT